MSRPPTQTIDSSQQPLESSSLSRFHCRYGCTALITTKDSLWDHHGRCKLKKNTQTTIPSSQDNEPTGNFKLGACLIKPLVANKSIDIQASVLMCDASTQTDGVLTQYVEKWCNLLAPSVVLPTQTPSKDKRMKQLRMQKIKQTLLLKPKFTLKGLQVHKKAAQLKTDTKLVDLEVDKIILSKADFKFKYQQPNQKKSPIDALHKASFRVRNFFKAQLPSKHQQDLTAIQPIKFSPPPHPKEIQHDLQTNDKDDIDNKITDCSDLIAQLVTKHDCMQVYDVLTRVKMAREKLAVIRELFPKLHELSYSYGETSLLKKDIVGKLQIFIEKLTSDIEQRFRLWRSKYLQAFVSRILKDCQKKVRVNLKTLFLQYGLLGAFKDRDLVITTELYNADNDTLVNLIQKRWQKVKDWADSCNQMMTNTQMIADTLPNSLNVMPEVQLLGLKRHLEHLNIVCQLDDKQVRVQIEDQALKVVLSILWCGATGELNCSQKQLLQDTINLAEEGCTKIKLQDLTADCFEYQFDCSHCDFYYEVQALVMIEELQGIVKLKRAAKLKLRNKKERKQIKLKEGGTDGTIEQLGTVCVTKLSVEQQQQILAVQALQPSQVKCNKVTYHQIIPKSQVQQKTMEEMVDDFYITALRYQGKLDLNEFYDTCHKRIKMCVVKKATGLRIKPIGLHIFKKKRRQSKRMPIRDNNKATLCISHHD